MLRCVGATTVVCRELNGGCVDVTFQSKGEDEEGGGGGEKRRSKVRPAGSSPHLTAFYAIYTFESVADDDRGLHRIVLGALSTPLYGVTIDEATSRHANWPLFFSTRPFSLFFFFLSLSLSFYLSIHLALICTVACVNRRRFAPRGTLVRPIYLRAMKEDVSVRK